MKIIHILIFMSLIHLSIQRQIKSITDAIELFLQDNDPTFILEESLAQTNTTSKSTSKKTP